MHFSSLWFLNIVQSCLGVVSKAAFIYKNNYLQLLRKNLQNSAQLEESTCIGGTKETGRLCSPTPCVHLSKEVPPGYSLAELFPENFTMGLFWLTVHWVCLAGEQTHQ